MSMKGVTRAMEAQENNLTHDDIYKEFCEWSPKHAAMIIDYKPWGSTSILIRLNNGQAYKCKRCAQNRFIMQMVSELDIKKKYNLI